MPQVLGGGSPLVDSLVITDYPLAFLLLLLVGKFLFTMLCFGSGVPGGIFLPMLVLGSLGGAVFAKLAIVLGVLPAPFAVNCIVFGMAAYFSAVVKSPITGSILIMEMTGSFEHMLALIIVSMTAYLVADLTGGQPVYDMLLERSLAVREKIKRRIRRKRILLELPVAWAASWREPSLARLPGLPVLCSSMCAAAVRNSLRREACVCRMAIISIS